MFHIKTKIFILAIIGFSTSSNAQDLIYSQFNSMPLAINPAFAGNNSCNYRLSAIGRSQWMGVTGAKSYQSGTVAGDFNLNNIYDERYNIWGLGVMASYDQAGAGSFTNFQLMANLAYHVRFGDGGKNFFSLGLQGGLGQRGVNPGSFLFDEQIDNYGRIVDSKKPETFTNVSKIYPELGFGSILTLNPSENANIYIGASAFHLLNPDISFTNEEYKQPIRTNIHAGGNFIVGNLIYIPSFYFQYQQKTNYNIGTYVGKLLMSGNENSNPIMGYLGLWYKSSDAITPAIRFDVGRTTIAASYDIHIGGVSQNLNGIGSPELSVNFYGCFSRSSRRTGCPSL